MTTAHFCVAFSALLVGLTLLCVCSGDVTRHRASLFIPTVKALMLIGVLLAIATIALTGLLIARETP